MRETARTGTAGKASVLIILAWLIMAGAPFANAETCAEWVGKIVSAQGNVEAKRFGEPQWRQVELGAIFCPGDMVRVRERSRADILMSNDAVIRLDQNTAITFPEPEKKDKSLIDMLNGAAYFFSRFPRGFKVKTPFVNASVEGTEFFIRVESDRTVASIFEGTVALTNEAGSLTLTTGQSAEAIGQRAPVLRVVVRPRDAVHWALYYPPVLYYRAVDVRPESPRDWQAALQRSLGSYEKGDIDGAFREIADVPDDLRDPRFFVYRASLLLSVGRVDEARVDAERALSLSPDNVEALALQTVIAVVQNEKDSALTLGRRAVLKAPDSAAALIALSYALQASFDLHGSLDALKKATRAEPENALAWARLAELYLSFGELDEALKAAEKAASLGPDLARTQTVLGYAYLGELRTTKAKEVFERAMLLDQADPLPRLGLGLAKIKENDLAGGRSEIEIASSLDPGNSLIRSYQGKAYYEEKRDGLAADQYRMAKELDPLDPTPWFYDAIRKQTINRPVEALRDLGKSTMLNDNRMVYRSRELLDEDLAARSASQARIYGDLGFRQLALSEGWKSVNVDPANYSAHRFLADSYSALPRHEIARVSELLLSQLLQPINVTPIQPSLAEANLFILDGAGPSAPSFNEYNPLFIRDRASLLLSGVAGGNGTLGEEVIASGIYRDLSFSAGQFHYESNGFRENNDQRQNIYNVFTQWSPTYRTSLQAEYRHRSTDAGDLSLRFNPDVFSRDQRESEDTDSVRVGFRHSFSPNSIILGSATYQDQDLHRLDIERIDATGYGVEGQYLYRTGALKVISGAGYFMTEQDSEIVDFPSQHSDTDHTNLYLYSYVKYPKQFTWTFGLSADLFRSDFLDLDKEQVNPKFGVVWTPFTGTTVRAAVFRTLKRTLLNDQTLEPTQVAGFNQFFDDPTGTEAWRYGIGIDLKIIEELYAGAEISRRDLEVPGQTIDFETGEVSFSTFDLDERAARAYVYWAPHPWFALRTEYQYEEFKRPDDFVFAEDLVRKVHTNRVVFGMNFFHPSGLFVQLQPTYVSQDGEFFGPSGVERGDDQFWVFDASIGFRLPKRYGIVAVDARNLFNEKFRFQDTDPAHPRIYPERLILARMTLSL